MDFILKKLNIENYFKPYFLKEFIEIDMTDIKLFIIFNLLNFLLIFQIQYIS